MQNASPFDSGQTLEINVRGCGSLIGVALSPASIDCHGSRSRHSFALVAVTPPRTHKLFDRSGSSPSLSDDGQAQPHHSTQRRGASAQTHRSRTHRSACRGHWLVRSRSDITATAIGRTDGWAARPRPPPDWLASAEARRRHPRSLPAGPAEGGIEAIEAGWPLARRSGRPGALHVCACLLGPKLGRGTEGGRRCGAGSRQVAALSVHVRHAWLAVL